MNQNKYYYIFGDINHPEKIKEALQKAGATKNEQECCYSNLLYYIKNDGSVGVEMRGSLLYNMFIDFGTRLEIESEYDFKPFDKVLIRDTEDDVWKIDLYGYKKGNMYICLGYNAFMCIPYEGHEHLLGTTNNVDYVL